MILIDSLFGIVRTRFTCLNRASVIFFNLLFERYELQLETIAKEPEAMKASSIFFVCLLTIYWFFF